ncbi:hypothetical protein [Rubripirellula reticaptiva]|uniref:Uncharacterized protein n=1 Tax=Rubripirellula reticaptiva TaxID=2528013 RepID=A0A5C6F487_9BACT|nr:hypothetical protein [Rubripirellula reticaptiva]TWU55340.1 hypothetical protein Poly59_16370 [Rubripirellula reticaptiva]
MLWPIILPLKITLWVLAGFIVTAVVVAPLFKWRRGKVAFVSLLVALLAFIPVCAGIGSVLDSNRFGVFDYETYAEVQDFRIERYLPPEARDITIDKYAMGYRARYTIKLDELAAYLDESWAEADGRSAVPRDQLGDGDSVASERFGYSFDGLDWGVPADALHFHSPVQSDGGGADYYFDPQTNIVLQHAGYW